MSFISLKESSISYALNAIQIMQRLDYLIIKKVTIKMKLEERAWLKFLKKKEGKDDPEIRAELARDEAFNCKIKKDKKVKVEKDKKEKEALKSRIKKGIAKIRGK